MPQKLIILTNLEITPQMVFEYIKNISLIFSVFFMIFSWFFESIFSIPLLPHNPGKPIHFGLHRGVWVKRGSTVHNLHNLHTLFFDRRLIEANEAATNDVHQPSSAPFVHKRSYISPFRMFTSGLKGHQSSLELGHVSGCSFWPYQWLTNSTYISVKLHIMHLVECAHLALKLLKLKSWNSRCR